MKRFARVVSAILLLVMAIEVRAQAPSVPSQKVHKIAIGGEGVGIISRRMLPPGGCTCHAAIALSWWTPKRRKWSAS